MKIAIAGFGIEGQSNYAYYSRLGHEPTIVDERHDIEDIPAGALTMLGDGVFNRLEGFDLVVRTAGLSPRDIITDGKIWSSTNEFFAKCPARIIGVTGTKGKGTTSSLIASMLQAAGKTVHLLGNIGVPALDVLARIQPDDIVVFELSSFQLWDLERSPSVAVVLMIEPDHLDVHSSFEDYVAAKSNIRRWQGADDMCIYHPTNPYSKQIVDVGEWPRTAHRYGLKDDGQAYQKSNTFFVQDDAICSIEAVQLPGKHNLENVAAAISVARIYTDDNSAIEAGIRSFHGLDHRLKRIGMVNGVSYYDDSIATTPGSTIAALQAFDDPKIVIMGGSSKGADFDEVAIVAKDRATKMAILIGEEADRLETVFEKAGIPTRNLGKNCSMVEVVGVAAEKATPGDVVILSPACASFGMFKNYSDRGDQFIAAVNALQ